MLMKGVDIYQIQQQLTSKVLNDDTTIDSCATHSVKQAPAQVIFSITNNHNRIICSSCLAYF